VASLTALHFGIYASGRYYGTIAVTGAARTGRVVVCPEPGASNDPGDWDELRLAAIHHRTVDVRSRAAVALWLALTRTTRDTIAAIEPQLAIALDAACLAAAELADLNTDPGNAN
jgi:hypothetical protein